MSASKIALIGISGSGKSTYSREVAKRTRLPLFHMDQLFWKGNWEAVPESKYIEAQKQLLQNEKWIIEGYVDEALAERLQQADLIIYLDYPALTCFFRVLRRWFMHRKTSRLELPEEALERFSLRLLWVVLTKGERPGTERALKLAESLKVVRVRSPRELAMLKLF